MKILPDCMFFLFLSFFFFFLPAACFLTRHYWWACHFLKFYPLNVWCQTATILSTDVPRRHALLDLTYFKLNKLPHTIYWKSLITISGMSGWDVRLCDFNRFSWRKKMIKLFANSEYMYLEQTPLGLNCLLNTLFGDSRLKWVEHHKMPVKPHHMFTCRPRWRSWMRVRLETRRSRVRPPPRSATFFRGDWSWNIFYGHSLPSADSRRAVVSFWRKNVHNTG